MDMLGEVLYALFIFLHLVSSCSSDYIISEFIIGLSSI
jgi:hypothetical protein